MGNKASTAPSTSPVQALQKSTVRRNSEYRSRTVETPNPEELFKTSADIRSKFVFGDVPIKRLKQEDRFLAHCERFVAALDSVIAHLDEIGAVIENAEALGKKHAAMAKDLRNEHWRLFGDILVERIIENDTKQPSGGSEVHAAWKMLGQLLVFHMRLGYDRETLRTVRDNRLLAVTDPRTDNNHLCIPDHGVR
ncbi:hypothetical protein Tcan_06616 [Toxocara canis]|uniref:Globin domain-containing protein n=1 Tax=Toxocara canis TaxID=6265 RepID=A0A0B2USY2_TOXCA|nr:hypothetical protein Tcan_06616 [Toxocara canis]